MKINAVLQKYPELERPEAVFEISNIAPGIGESERINCMVKTVNTGISINPPFVNTFYEYRYPSRDLIYLAYAKKDIEDILITLHIASGSGPIQYIGGIIIPIDAKGRMDENRKIQYLIRNSMMKEIETALLDKQAFGDYLEIYLLPVFYANALLNCKNVSTDAHDFPNRRSISHYKKTGKPYFEKYYTLKVKLPGKKHTAGSGENGGWSNAFHIYRGHFKTYTEAAPLFGKFTGTYWWESGIRGGLETGIIDKDYELEVGE